MLTQQLEIQAATLNPDPSSFAQLNVTLDCQVMMLEDIEASLSPGFQEPEFSPLESQSNVLEELPNNKFENESSSENLSEGSQKNSPFADCWEDVDESIWIEPLTLDDDCSKNSNCSSVKSDSLNSPVSKKSKKKGANGKAPKSKKKPVEKRVTKSELEWLETQKARKEILTRVNTEIIEKVSVDKSLLLEKSQSIRFNECPLIKEFTKIALDTKKFIKKAKKGKRKISMGDPPEIEQDDASCAQQEKIFKEVTKKSSLKGSELEFTYNFPITC